MQELKNLGYYFHEDYLSENIEGIESQLVREYLSSISGDRSRVSTLIADIDNLLARTNEVDELIADAFLEHNVQPPATDLSGFLKALREAAMPLR